MAPFEPAGVVARWRVIYGMLTGTSVGDVVTYADLGAELGLESDDERDRRKIQMAMIRAAKEFEQVDKHALETVPNVGYRVAEAEGHLRLARRHQRKANGQLERGGSKVTNIDLNGVAEETRRVIEATARCFAMQADFNRRLSDRQDRTERLLDELAGRLDRIEGERVGGK